MAESPSEGLLKWLHRCARYCPYFVGSVDAQGPRADRLSATLSCVPRLRPKHVIGDQMIVKTPQHGITHCSPPSTAPCTRSDSRPRARLISRSFLTQSYRAVLSHLCYPKSAFVSFKRTSDTAFNLEVGQSGREWARQRMHSILRSACSGQGSQLSQCSAVLLKTSGNPASTS